MELTQLLFTGSLSGLLSVLAHATFWGAVSCLVRGNTVPRYAEPPLAEAFLHMAAGIALAFLFWLSWGLAGLTENRWWVRGLIFGGLAWFALALPTVAGLVAGRIIDARAGAFAGSRWATTALGVGLACAWSWHRAA
jgi:hypothetical protein